MRGLAALALGLLSLPAAAADGHRGARVFALCKACHALEASARPMVGPGLHGLFGRVAGTRADFAYSPAMRHAGIAWTDETLARFLADPRAAIPGNRMAFPGVRKAEDRDALIDFLKRATK